MKAIASSSLIAGAPGQLAWVAAGLVAVVVAFAIATGLKLPALALVGLAAITPFLLVSPAAVLMAWAATGPAFGGRFAVVPGGGLPAVTLDRVLLIALSAVVMVQWARRSRSLARPGGTEMLMAIFVALCATTAIAGGGTYRSPGEGGLRMDFVFLGQAYAIPFLGYFLARNLLASPRNMTRLLWVYVATGTFIAAVAILHHFTGISVFLPTRYEIIHEGRATGTLASANHMGIVLTVCALPPIVLLLRNRTLLQGAILAGSTALMIVAMYLSRTRAAYGGLAAALCVAALYDRRLRRPLLAVALVALLVLIVAWPLIMQLEFVKDRLLERSPVYNRVALAATSLNMFLDKPLLGHGFGRHTFSSERLQYLTGAGGVVRDYAHNLDVPHNEFLHVLILVGLAGFIPYVAVLVRAWRRCVQELRCLPATGTEHDVTVIALGALVIYVANALVADLMFCWYGSNLIFALLGVVEGLRARTAPLLQGARA